MFSIVFESGRCQIQTQYMLVIGIAGGTGSGKTTVVRKIIESLPKDEVAVMPQDCYYKDNAHIPLETRLKMNYDEPASIEWSLLCRQLEELKKGDDIEMPTDERLIRVIHRDCIERGRTPQMVIDRYQETLKPMHELHIEPTKRYADLIVPQGGNNKVAIRLLTDYIRSLLPSSNNTLKAK